MSGRHASPAAGRPGERIVRVGAVLFGLGCLAVLAAVVPVLVDADATSPAWAATSSGVLLPLGLAVALLGLLRGARARRRAARRSSNPT